MATPRTRRALVAAALSVTSAVGLTLLPPQGAVALAGTSGSQAAVGVSTAIAPTTAPASYAFSTLLDVPATPDTGTVRGDLLELVRGLVRALTGSPAAALMPALIEAAERDAAFAAVHHQEAARRHEAVMTVISRGVHRGELPPTTDAAEVIDLVTGPIFYRRYVSHGAVDEAFADVVVDLVLTGLHARGMEPHPAHRQECRRADRRAWMQLVSTAAPLAAEQPSHCAAGTVAAMLFDDAEVPGPRGVTNATTEEWCPRASDRLHRDR